MHCLCCTDPTSPPGNPGILDYDKDYVEVNFEPPEKENGAPVQGYVIEYREKGDKDWQKVRDPGLLCSACQGLM